MSLRHEEWEEIARILAKTAETCEAFEAWGFIALYELDGEQPPHIIVRSSSNNNEEAPADEVTSRGGEVVFQLFDKNGGDEARE